MSADTRCSRASDLEWGATLGWSIIPAACGNVLGGFLLVVVPFWVAFGSKHSAMLHDGRSGEDS